MTINPFKPITPHPGRKLSLYDSMWNDQKGLCCYCECEMLHKSRRPARLAEPKNMATDEHLKRRIDGGGNEPGNRRLACFECNSGRGAMDWLTYKSYKRGELTCV